MHINVKSFAWKIRAHWTKVSLLMCRREHEDEGMEDWSQEELEKAVAEKHAAEKGPQKTDIICKFFLDAVEKKLYGW